MFLYSVLYFYIEFDSSIKFEDSMVFFRSFYSKKWRGCKES